MTPASPPGGLEPLKSVIIVGGSLSGLMHALPLLTHHSQPHQSQIPQETTPEITVTILERSPSTLLHNQGAGVVAGPDLQAFFARYVLPFSFSSSATATATAGGDQRQQGQQGQRQQMGVGSKQRLYIDKEGNVIEGSVEDRGQRMVGWDGLYRLLRWRVDGLDASAYLENLEDAGVEDKEEKNGGGGGGGGGEVVDLDSDSGQRKAKYETGCKVTSVAEESDAADGGVRVFFTNESGEEKSLVADLVLAADGGNSAVRRMLLPSVQRTYVGYVAFRGTVPESTISKAAADVFVEKFAFFHTEGIQILAYLIPGENGTLKKGERLVNWVWYCNYPEDSAEYTDLMTDKDGKQHAVTLPVGGMQVKVWEKQKRYAEEVLPPQYAELVVKTTHPFVQCITDVISPENTFMNGKVLLVGDALAGFRPHTAASTGQGAFDALTFAELLQGKIDRAEYSEKVMKYAQRVQKHGVMLGERSQFGRHPFAG